jgi:hypothetical protein
MSARSPHVLRRRRKSARARKHAIQRFTNYMGPRMITGILELAFRDSLFPRLLYRDPPT